MAQSWSKEELESVGVDVDGALAKMKEQVDAHAAKVPRNANEETRQRVLAPLQHKARGIAHQVMDATPHDGIIADAEAGLAQLLLESVEA